MECGPTVLEQIARLRRGGAQIAIDDFGSGSSSLARLKSLPFDAVKLDPSLVAGIEHDRAARDIVQAVIGLVHGLGARAVAEGVETEGQYRLLRTMGCDAAQGYVIAPPMTVRDYRLWAASARPRMSA
jgi:EAL domain-containing protein (putative c-di-GMP-specific phosphodiesterase class I)